MHKTPEPEVQTYRISRTSTLWSCLNQNKAIEMQQTMISNKRCITQGNDLC